MIAYTHTHVLHKYVCLEVSLYVTVCADWKLLRQFGTTHDLSTLPSTFIEHFSDTFLQLDTFFLKHDFTISLVGLTSQTH